MSSTCIQTTLWLIQQYNLSFNTTETISLFLKFLLSLPCLVDLAKHHA